MNEKPDKSLNNEESDIPVSLRRQVKEPQKILHTRIAVRQWDELVELSREYNQDISIFIREAIEDWLRRARKARIASSNEGD